MKAIIIHGTKGSPQGNWFPWLAGQLQTQGFDVQVPHMPTPDGQNLQNWLAAFDRIRLDQNTILIGHSMGAGFILRLLEHGGPICGAILVAPFMAALGLPEYDVLNKSFVEGPVDWQKIKSNSREFRVIAGDDDPYVPFMASKQVADGLGCPLTVIPGGKHLNAESGYTEFPILRDMVLDLAKAEKPAYVKQA
ncbi:MAG: hypothetical protein EYC62_01695 [Alphaproteobacteria bacterium]|nr:MAG: hypothetical protein EYC62_01695 [Alphaproteobacteria bacterium]